MQIFNDKTFITGTVYLDDEKQPRDGSIVIDDSSPEAEAILAGFDFEFKDGGVEIKQEKREEIVEKETKEREEEERLEKIRVIEEKRATKRAAVLQLVIQKRKNKQAMTIAELQDAVEVLLDAVLNPEEEA
jgi:hypothetical protein